MSDISNGQDMPPDNRRYSQTSTIKLKNLVLKQDVEDGTTKYKVKKLDECAHFHYEFVELKRIEVIISKDISFVWCCQILLFLIYTVHVFTWHPHCNLFSL